MKNIRASNESVSFCFYHFEKRKTSAVRLTLFSQFSNKVSEVDLAVQRDYRSCFILQRARKVKGLLWVFSLYCAFIN